MSCPEAELAGFLEKYMPDVAAAGREVIDKLHGRFPTATRLVYDNYNALVIGFGSDDRPSNAILSVTLYPKWVSLFFLQVAGLEDPADILRGGGVVAKHIVLAYPGDLDGPDVSTLIDQAFKAAKKALPSSGGGGLIIRSVSPKQRPRRP